MAQTPDDLDDLSAAPTPRRRPLRADVALAILPTATVLAALYLVETLGGERLLFASLASSAFLIYLDPEHRTNAVRTLVVSQIAAAAIGFAAQAGMGPGYGAAAAAVVVTVVLLVFLDLVHPPAVATALSFAFRADTTGYLVLFALAVGLVAVLVVVQQVSVRVLRRAGVPAPR